MEIKMNNTSDRVVVHLDGRNETFMADWMHCAQMHFELRLALEGTYNLRIVFRTAKVKRHNKTWLKYVQSTLSCLVLWNLE